MVEQLFGSKTRVKLLQLFYSNPNRSFYVREITRKIDEQINSVRRELANLLSIGIISSDNSSGSKLYYEVNQKYEYYDALSAIFGGKKKNAAKSVKTPTDEASEFKALGNVDLVIYTGQFTRDETAGVDVVIVGDLNQTQVNKYVAELEQKEGKELRFVVMAMKEFEYRRQVNDRFINTVLHSKLQVLLDKHKLLEEK